MASTKEYLAYVLEQLAALEGITQRPMMGEFLLYCRGKLVGGVYDDRLLLKATPSALRLLAEAGLEAPLERPYDGAKEMLLADVDRPELLCRLLQAVADDLPAPKRRPGRKPLSPP